MLLPPKNADSLFEEFLQELPAELEEMAYEFKAFARSRKVSTPQDLMRAVMLYCGLDKVLREVAGIFTLLNEKITDQAIADRLRACGPWIKAMLRKMLQIREEKDFPAQVRLLVVDASTIQRPGSTGTENRLHIVMDLVKLEFVYLEVTDEKTGESLKNFPVKPGDIFFGGPRL